jgi:hypothetical protein
MERIIGSPHGLYIVTYTMKTAEGHFGYAKICSSRPGHAWDGTVALARLETGPYFYEYMALIIAIDLALEAASLVAAHRNF